MNLDDKLEANYTHAIRELIKCGLVESKIIKGEECVRLVKGNTAAAIRESQDWCSENVKYPHPEAFREEDLRLWEDNPFYSPN